MAELSCPAGGSLLVTDIVGEINDQDSRDIWSYLYYADEADPDSRILVMDQVNMELVREVELSADSHAGSVDRAGFTDKMYCRTAVSDADPRIEVINAKSGKYIKKISLNYRPRSSGGYNRYRGLQAISTKDEAYVNVIDVASDKVVITEGVDHTTEVIGGNDGGNATGHTVWLDANYFALLDRYIPAIKLYKIAGDYPPYTTTLEQTLSTPTGCHSLRSAEAGFLLSDTVFYAAIEGSTLAKDNVVPQMWKIVFDPNAVSGSQLTVDATVISFPAPITVDYRIHHFGIDNTNGKMAVPVAPINNGASKVYIIDLATWALESTSYDAGRGGGHADYSSALNMWVITNHYDNDVTLIEPDETPSETAVVIAAEDPLAWGDYTQSHANHISGDGLFYHFFESANGIFMEIDLTTKLKTDREVTTGGKPIQSFS